MKSSNGRNAVEGDLDSRPDIWDEERLAALLNFDNVKEPDKIPDLDSSLDEEELETPEYQELAEQEENNAISQAELFDDADEPHAGKTQATFSGNPLAKFGAVALGLFFVFGIAAFFLNNIMGAKIGRAPSNIETGEKAVRSPDSPAPKNETGEYKTQLALSEQEEQIKALSDARDGRGPNTLKRPDKPDKNQPKTPNSQIPTPQSPSTVPRATVAAPPTYSAPARPTPRITPAVPVERSEPVRRMPSEPVSEPIARATPPRTPVATLVPSPAPLPAPLPASPPASAPTQLDPMAQWRSLSSLGSYGESIDSNIEGDGDAGVDGEDRAIARQNQSVERSRTPSLGVATTVPRAVQVPQHIPEIASGFNAPQTAVIAREVLSEQEQAILDEQRDDIPGSSPAALLASEEPTLRNADAGVRAPEILQPQEAALMQEMQQQPPEAIVATGESFRRLEVGQQVAAQLVTPVVGFEASRRTPTTGTVQGQDTERFVVQLKQPLVDKDGATLLPAQLLIIFEVQSIAENGLINADAVALVDGEAEYRLPPGVISIRGEDGSPFIATAVRAGGREIFSRDAKAFGLGALAKVGEILNRPESEETSESNSDFSSRRSSRVNRGKPNILGAVLEGGFSPLVAQVLERNQRAIDRIQSRPPLWVAEEGKEVLVFVNSTFEL